MKNKEIMTEEEIFNVRDDFFEAEGDFPKELIESDCEYSDIIYDLRDNFTNEELFEQCNNLMGMVETGQVKQEEMQMVESKLVLLFAAIREKILVKKLVKEYNTAAIRRR